MGSIFVIVFLSCFGVPYADYKSSAQPVNWLLMPATVSLAIPLYEKWELLEKEPGRDFCVDCRGRADEPGQRAGDGLGAQAGARPRRELCRNP